MTDVLFRTQFADCLAEAHSRGVRCPVMVVLAPDSWPEQLVRAERSYQPHARRARTTCTELGRMEAWSVPTTVHWLQVHAGLGGAALANLLDDPPRCPDYWLLYFTDRVMLLLGLHSGRVAVESSAFYDQLALQHVAAGADETASPGQVTASFPDGSTVAVNGPTQRDAATIATLVEIVATRSLPALRRSERSVALPLTDEQLAHIVRTFYGRRPDHVAEAIRVLREAGKPWHRRLLRLLGPNWRELAVARQHAS